MNLTEILGHIHPVLKIVLIIILTLAAHFGVKAIRRFSQYLLTMRLGTREVSEASLIRKYPKIATIITLLVSAVTFTLYFLAIGLILREFKISLTTYFASATVIGLAVGFGLQGFVQDLVIGLTLIFSNALSIGDVVKLGDEIGRVDNIGLRFTALINLYGQQILIPNRNIATIGKFRGGCIRAYVDIPLPQKADEKATCQAIHTIARGMHNQHRSIILDPPQKRGFVMYGIQGHSWVALGDPVGPPEVAEELAWQYREMVERHGGQTLFYEVGTSMMHVYLDMGLALFKLGEEASVDLADFSLKGKKRSALRYSHRRLEKDGCSFEMIPSPELPKVLPALRKISDAWLNEKNTSEKGFSLGSFEESYVLNFPAAVFRLEDEITKRNSHQHGTPVIWYVPEVFLFPATSST